MVMSNGPGAGIGETPAIFGGFFFYLRLFAAYLEIFFSRDTQIVNWRSPSPME